MARAVAPYTGPLRDAILYLKSRGTLRVAAALGELMAGAVLREPVFAAAEVIIPVPLTRKRLAGRGFNQARLLALELGRVLDMPVDSKSVVKIRETRPQTGLSRLERENNLIDAFSVVEPDAVGGKKVLLVDDVFTTGATVENISLTLRRSHTEAVFVITAAGGTG
jgi:ComF family protein